MICRAALLPLACACALVAISACTPAASDGIDPAGKTFDAIGPEETINLLGTEPFWALAVRGDEGMWTTPDNQPGTQLTLTRFAGNNGLGLSGTLGGQRFTATLTPGECSDGMSDRRFPYVATVAVGDATYQGCGYTASQPFTGDPAP